MQAEACRLDPDVRMNPILLKPDSDLGSQVVLNGRAIGNFKVREYFQRKPELWGEVAKAYDSLASEHDVIVLEGAGSPGEINLKSGDLVNMRMARHAGARVLLAGDIDRGGVYASFVGTYATLEPWERALLSGFLVNKFRGDPTLLADAHAYVERMTGRPVRGVIDYQRDLGLPEEDSVNFSFVRPAEKEAKTLDIVLIRLGYVANFTDFTPFEIEPDVTLRKVSSPADFGAPDAVILPGSKSVAADLARLRESGLAAKVAEAAERGVAVAGICGGLQLLGERLLDPDGIESAEREVRCLGLLPLETVMRRRKTLRRTRGFRPDGTEISGYEIHHGETVPTGPGLGIMRDTEGRMIGFERGGLFASYLHGIFDDDRFRRLWLDGPAAEEGMGAEGRRYGLVRRGGGFEPAGGACPQPCRYRRIVQRVGGALNAEGRGQDEGAAAEPDRRRKGKEFERLRDRGSCARLGVARGRTAVHQGGTADRGTQLFPEICSGDDVRELRLGLTKGPGDHASAAAAGWSGRRSCCAASTANS